MRKREEDVALPAEQARDIQWPPLVTSDNLLTRYTLFFLSFSLLFLSPFPHLLSPVSACPI